MAKTFRVYPNQRNFDKSGHTACHVCTLKMAIRKTEKSVKINFEVHFKF